MAVAAAGSKRRSSKIKRGPKHPTVTVLPGANDAPMVAHRLAAELAEKTASGV